MKKFKELTKLEIIEAIKKQETLASILNSLELSLSDRELWSKKSKLHKS